MKDNGFTLADHFWGRSLKTRMTLATVAAFIVGIWALSYYVTRTLRDDTQKLLGDQQAATVSYVAAELDQELESRIHALEKVARSIDRSMLENPVRLQQRLDDRPIFLDMFNAGVIVVALDGTAVADAPVVVGRRGANYGDNESIHVALAEGKALVGRPVMGRILHQPLFNIIVPIRAADGTVIGALFGVINLTAPNFLDRIRAQRYGKSGGYLVFAPQHRLIVAATDKSRAMQPIPPPGVNPTHDKRMQGLDVSEVSVNSLGVEVLSSSSRIPSAGWFVVATLPTEEAFAPIRDMQRRIAAATVLLTLLASVFIWGLLRRQLSPLKAAVANLGEMSVAGELHPLPVVKKDEIGQLIGGFNSLLESATQHEEALKQSEARFRLMFEHNDCIMLLIEPDSGDIVDANAAAARFYGYPVEHLKTMRIDQINTLPQDELHEKLAQASHHERSAFVFSHRLASGEVRTVEVRSSPVDVGGRDLLFSIVQDVTSRKQAEVRLAESEFRLRTIFETEPECIKIIDAQGCLVQMNPAGLAMIEADSLEQVAGRPVFDLIVPESREAYAELHRRVIAGEAMQMQYEVLGLKGGRRWLETHAVPMQDKGGTVHLAVTRDISERKRIGERMERLVTEQKALLENELVGIVKVRDRVIVWANPAYEKMLGYEPGELAGKPTRNHYPSEEAYLAFGSAAYPKLAAGNIFRSQVEHVRKDGGRIWLDVSGKTLDRDTGETLWGFSDISALVKAADELKRSNTELEQFSYGISHDMRQPLRMIASYLQLLEKDLGDQLDEEKRDYFNFAIDGAKRMDAMMLGLLDYARVGRKGEPAVWVESRAVLDEALLFLRPAIAEAKAVVRIEGDWPHVFVSRDEILRLLQNLIGNALKFRVAGRIPEIRIDSETVGQEWRVCVADNGVGILNGQIDRLFQVFQRLHSRTAYEGTGIGLALSRRIAEHHGGRIWAESAGEGQGSRFCVALPMRVEEAG
jgi:PAS domain S-box-containing protein